MPDIEIRQAVPLRTVPGVELAAIGTWEASTGTTTFTPEDFLNAVAALECPGVRNPVLKLGHDETDSTSGVRWDGEPAVGWIGNMRFDGAKMIGDYTGLPAWLADQDENGLSVLMSAYPDRSIEIRRPFVCQIGHTHPSVITAVALLGVFPPGIGVLKSMQDVYATFTEPLSGDAERTFAKAMLSTTIRLAADDPPRGPLPHEIAATTDFPRLQKQWQSALDDLLAAWPDISAAQRDELSAQITDAVDKGKPDDLANLAADSVAAALLLGPAMRKLGMKAAKEQAAEASRQGVEVEIPDLPDGWLDDLAAGVTGVMAASTAATAGRDAAQLLGQQSDGKAIAAAVAANLAGLSDRFLRDQIGGALSAAQAAGRFAVIEVAPIGVYYASEVLDKATCAPCKSIDGTKYDDPDTARSAYGSGKYVGCLSHGRCRGQVVAVWGDKLAAPMIRTTVRMSIGAPMPTLPSAAVRASVSVEDISRKFYEANGYSRWITAMHIDPLELIAADDSDGKFYRIPVELKGEEFQFGDAAEVAVTYTDVKTAATAMPYRWQDKASALAAAGKAADGTDVSKPPVVPATPVVPIAPDVTPAGAAIRTMAATATKTPDVEVTPGPATTPEEASVPFDAAKYREAFELSAELSDDEVRAAALAALTPEAVAPTGATASDLSAMEALTSSGQAVLVDKAQLAALIETSKKGEIAYNQNRKNERDAFLKTAVTEGRIPPASLGAYEKLWDNDPEGTRKTVSLLTRNIIPVQSVGYMGAEVSCNETDAAYEAVYGKVGA